MPSDIANLLVLVAPFALWAPVLAGWVATRAFLKRPESKLIIAAAVPLLPFAILVGASGLGLHRDWDASALLGMTLTVGAVTLLATLSAAKLRAALVATLPLAMLISLGWVAVNADEAASLARAEALATMPPLLAPSQRGQILFYLGGWATTHGQPSKAAEFYEMSYRLAPTPNRGMLAARAWAAAGRPAAALRMLGHLRARVDLDSATRARAEALEQQLESGS
jgi:hypothetical protein